MAATNEFMHHLSMAACEWFLMFLMYIDAALGFILTRFAHQCELQTPCLFCFRFDHVFGDKPDYYLSHFCNNHRAEISSLVSCNLHHKLSDVREMCDDCFMSTMKQKQGYPKPLLNRNLVRAPSSTGSCSCCKKQWKPKPRSKIKLGVPKVTRQPPLPLIAGRACGRYRRRNYFKKARDKISGTTTPCHVGNNIRVDVDMDALSDSGCADLKFNSCSDAESGDSFYEIECENEGFEDDSCVIIRQVEHFKSFSNLEPFKSFSNLEPSLPNGTHNESVVNPLSFTSNGSMGHAVKENGSLKVSTETSSFNQDSPSPNDHEGYESPSTHSVGEIKGESDMEKLKRQMEYDQEQIRELSKELEEERSAAAIAAEAPSSPDKHEGFGSPSTHSVGDIKGENEMEKLKRQMEYDHEQLRLLHKELEEERNAAAIAADEAMAMITRLQEEKSALHMEALQYLRMMDEQAEYDMEALDKANDLVTEKDKEIQDLEAELEYFRSRYEDESINGNATVNFKENHTVNGKIDSVSSSGSKSMNTLESRANNHALLDLEDEKKYILNSISELERKGHQLSDGNNGLSQQNETHTGTLENEISDLNEWLEAVESDRDFLEHACNTVQSHVGVEFIQKIARHLHDMRRVRFDRRCQTVG